MTPWTIAQQAPLTMEFSRQEYWRPFPSPGDLLQPGIKPGFPQNLGFVCRQILYLWATKKATWFFPLCLWAFCTVPSLLTVSSCPGAVETTAPSETRWSRGTALGLLRDVNVSPPLPEALSPTRTLGGAHVDQVGSRWAGELGDPSRIPTAADRAGCSGNSGWVS